MSTATEPKLTCVFSKPPSYLRLSLKKKVGLALCASTEPLPFCRHNLEDSGQEHWPCREVNALMHLVNF
jgi:hypothetical protein